MQKFQWALFLRFLGMGFVWVAHASAESTFRDDQIVSVAKSTEWHRLMHYRRTFPYLHTQSELDGEGFFFAADGKKNPEAELRATLQAFQTRTSELFGKLKQPPTCAFPARLNFLKRVLRLEVPEPPCEKLDNFMGRFNAASMTLVFSSAYPNNPGSMYGHTFLRINSKAGEKDLKRRDLLDFGLSYAAQVAPEENPIAFMVFGLAGGYPGQFSMEEYYKKVNEYNNGESRDLWEYDLSLSEAETRTVLLHAWEIETNSHFNYFFLDENCAYLILTLLEAARPEWEISQFKIYIIPAETVKRLADEPGAVTRIRFRPSLRRRMGRRFALLEAKDQRAAFSVFDGTLDPAKVDDPRILEASVSYLYYRQKEQQADFPAEKKKILADTLLRRSELPTLPEIADLEAPDKFSQPERGHFPYNLGVHYGHQERDGGNLTQDYIDLRWKFAYHDLLNSDIGYLPYSQMDWPAFTLRRDLTRDRFRLEELHIFSMTSLFPMTFVEKRPSWAFHLFARPPLDRNCIDCLAYHFDIGAGAAVEPLGRRWIIYGLLTPTVEFSSAFEHGPRFIPHAELSTIFTPLDTFKVQLSSRFYYDAFQSNRQKTFTRLEGNVSYAIGRAWDVRGNFAQIIPGNESETRNHLISGNLNYYFQ